MLRKVRFVAVASLVLAALTGCSITQAEGDQFPSPRSTPEQINLDESTSTQNDPFPSPPEHQSLGTVDTEAVEEELKAVGFAPAPEEYHEVLAWHEDNVCYTDLDDLGERGGFLFYLIVVIDEFNPDVIRIVAQHNCPERSEVIETFIEQVESR